ncbi:iron ABC transporter permease [Trinickia violacea]|uniref:Iron ABC transporter permease n=1 Tax=Trinickia violacea TaxID=2571746 RepID=A0A4P8IYC6_9BURK|nr:iron ABC transporter permease [Trinickia violacea]QCP52975.1 iron ABC transporter permease [Trinickia violacea]
MSNSDDTRVEPPPGATLARRLRRFEPSILLWLAMIAVLVFLVASPMLRLLISSFEEAETGRFTFANYRDAYGSLRHLQALLNSLELGAGVALLAGVLGVPIAWAISRTDMPAKSFVRLTVLGAFITPPYLGAIGWILLAGPNSGWLNRVWMAFTGGDHGIFNVYSMTGLILVVGVASFPYVFVFTNSALDLVSSEMEDAANILGAGTLRTTFRVTLPLVLPAILGGLIISFLEAIALFGAPALIALPARFNVVSTQLWQFFEYPVRVEEAAAYSIPLLLITMLMFWLQRALTGRKGYVAVSGKGGERRLIRLGRWRWAMLFYALFVATISVLLPMGVLLQAAFSKAWGRGFSIVNLTLGNFRYVLFEQTQAKQAILNTLLYAGATAFAAIGLSLAIAYVVSRKLVPWSSALAFLCMTPFVIPGVVLAIGFYAAYAPPPLALYGSATIMILAFTTRFLPIAYTSSAAGMRSINPEMEEAVRILGGGRPTAIRKVLAPLLKKSLAGAWILVFIPAARELSVAIFLVGPNTRVISVMLFDLSEEGNFEVLAALGTILLAVSIAIAALGYRVIGRDFLLRRN